MSSSEPPVMRYRYLSAEGIADLAWVGAGRQHPVPVRGLGIHGDRQAAGVEFVVRPVHDVVAASPASQSPTATACRQNLAGSSSQASSDSQATGGWPRRTHSAKRTVLPHPAGVGQPAPVLAAKALVQPLRQPQARYQAPARSAWWPAGHRAPTSRPGWPDSPSVTCTIGASSELASLSEAHRNREPPGLNTGRPPDPGRRPIVLPPSREESTRDGPPSDDADPVPGSEDADSRT